MKKMIDGDGWMRCDRPRPAFIALPNDLLSPVETEPSGSRNDGATGQAIGSLQRPHTAFKVKKCPHGRIFPEQPLRPNAASEKIIPRKAALVSPQRTGAASVAGIMADTLSPAHTSLL